MRLTSDRWGKVSERCHKVSYTQYRARCDDP